MIRATACAAASRPTVGSASARRRTSLSLLLTALALVGTAAVAQRAEAAERYQDDIWVSVDGVAFERGGESDEVAYVVRPLGSRGGQAYSRDLSRNEQNSGWAAFWEARQAYPDGYCVVWVEVEDASSWHETQDSTACTAEEPAAAPQKPTPTPAATKKDPKPTQAPPPKPAQTPAAEPASAPTQTPAGTTTPTPTPSPKPTSTPSPTPSPSPTASSTPSPSPSHAAPAAALLRDLPEQPAVRTQGDAAEQDDVISPLGWVAVLASGTLLTTGGVLMLWRRFT